MTSEHRIEFLLLQNRGNLSDPALEQFDHDQVRTIYNLIVLKWLLHEKTSIPMEEGEHLLDSRMILTDAGIRRLDLLERIAISSLE